eukprot:4700499-Pyramimonas_sp.AAC.1
MRKSWFGSPSRAPAQRRIYRAKVRQAQRANNRKHVKKSVLKKRKLNRAREIKTKVGASSRQATASSSSQALSPNDSAHARYCFRCERRMDKRREEGCHPRELHVDKTRFNKFLADFDRPARAMRYTADAMGVQ